jgi:transposase
VIGGIKILLMEKFKLTVKEKEILEQRHNGCRDGKERDRIKAVLLRSEGWTIPMIAQALRIHESTVARHINDYLDGKLNIASGGSNSMLNEVQTNALLQHLTQKTYGTTQEIIAYIEYTYGVTYSIPGMNKWLHRNEFSYKKPKGYPYKASEKEQSKFISAYKHLKSNLSSDDGILFMDACHPSMATKISYGWIKTGESKPLETTASRTRLNLIGALDLSRISKPIVASYTTVDGDSLVDFLHQIRKYSKIKGTIHLVLDRAGYHRCLDVINTAAKLNINLFYLPAYSPNLNAIERLWKVMNEYARNNRFFKTADEFRQSITDFFNITLPKISYGLRSRINDNFQKLDYAF